MSFYGSVSDLFFNSILSNPHLPLPEWVMARGHINKIFAQLHANFISTVNRVMHFSPPFRPVAPRPHYGESHADVELQSHLFTIEYFLAVFDWLERTIRRMQLHEAIVPLLNEMPRVIAILKVIQRIVHHEVRLAYPPARVEELHAIFRHEIMFTPQPQNMNHLTTPVNCQSEMAARSIDSGAVMTLRFENSEKSSPSCDSREFSNSTPSESQQLWGSDTDSQVKDEPAVSSDDEDFDCLNEEIWKIVNESSAMQVFEAPKSSIALPSFITPNMITKEEIDEEEDDIITRIIDEMRWNIERYVSAFIEEFC